MPPAFSVVIPSYNQAEFLRESLASVLGQTFQDFEIVVVNNQSTDHTLAVMEEANDPRIKVVNFSNDGVIGAGRNRGIENSTGEFVAFLDSDDGWHPSKLERVTKMLEVEPGIGLVCHDQEFIWEGVGRRFSKCGPPEEFRGDLHEYLLLSGNCISTSATVASRKYLVQVGSFSEERQFVTTEDYELWLRLSKMCEFRFIHEVLGIQRYHATSASANVELNLNNTLAILDCYFPQDSAEARPFPKSVVKRRYAKAYFFAARQFQRQGKLGRAMRYYTKTLRTYAFHKNAYAGLALLSADLVFGPSRRRKITSALFGRSWRWG